jgi:hypothetical protein
MNAAQTPEARQLIAQLADINGLDRIGWWPLAPGWWAVIALAIILAVAGIWLALRHHAYRQSWRHAAHKELADMQDRLCDLNTREILLELSGVLRRIAIKRFSRDICAGLEGSAWIQWLKKNDPSGFDWSEHTGLLTEVPYAPPGNMPPIGKVETLIDATQKWVQ